MNASRTALILGVAWFLAGTSLAAAPPGTVRIDPLTNHYEAVSFDHAMHVDIAENCATCHHHTAGIPPKDGLCAECHKNAGASDRVACRACHTAHPFSSAEVVAMLSSGAKKYHVDVPGLKGAYHLSCLGCHQTMDGPTGCTDCHARNASGDAMFRAGATGTPAQGAHN